MVINVKCIDAMTNKRVLASDEVPMRARHYRRIAPRLTRSAAGRLIFNRSAGHFLERREANEGRGVCVGGGGGEEVNQRRAEAARTISDVASGTDSPEKECLVLQRQLIMP